MNYEVRHVESIPTEVLVHRPDELVLEFVNVVDDLNNMDDGYLTFDEVFSATTEYFDGDTLAANVWVTKYALQDSNGNYLERTPTDMHHRLAREFAKIEAKYPNPMSEDEIFNLFDRYRYIVPQGSPMSAIGNDDKLQSLSNCFIIDPPDDSYASIMMADQRQAQIMKRRGGVGFDISKLRPRNTPTSNAARTASGVTTFMARFSNTCREVAQEGRRGALMLTISCFAGKTLVLTEDGWMDIKSIVDEQYAGKAWTHEGFKSIDDWQSLGEQDVYEVECENGKKITVTADHEFVVKNIETQAEYLKKISDVDPECEELVFYDVEFDNDVCK